VDRRLVWVYKGRAGPAEDLRRRPRLLVGEPVLRAAPVDGAIFFLFGSGIGRICGVVGVTRAREPAGGAALVGPLNDPDAVAVVMQTSWIIRKGASAKTRVMLVVVRSVGRP